MTPTRPYNDGKSTGNPVAGADEHSKEIVAKGGDIPAPKADEDGVEKPAFPKDSPFHEAYSAGLKVGYAQALEDIEEMLSRQVDLNRNGWLTDRRSNFGGP